MEGLNTLLNQVLRTENDSFIGANGLEKCYKSLEELSKSDKAASKVFLYFFPPNSSSEKNTDSFWFIKYEKENNYNEYEFAKDLLKIYIQYMKEKNHKSFESQILEKVKLFKNSKLIGNFLSVLEEFDEKLLAIISYIIKDCAYFKQEFELTIPSENIQTFLFVYEAKNYLSQRKLQKGLKLLIEEVKQQKLFNEKLKNEINELKEENSDLKKNNTRLMNVAFKLEDSASYWEKVSTNLEDTVTGLKNDIINKEDNNARLQNTINGKNNRINDLNNKVGVLEESNKKLKEEMSGMEEKMSGMEKKMSGMEERLENIDLRDTVKMSLRYIYKILLSKFPNEVKPVTKIWDQIEEIKKLLSQPGFENFNFIIQFINTITFDKLAHFNHIAHDSTKTKRDFTTIKKYMQVNADYDLDTISSFFEKLPNINKFINLNLLFYRDPVKVDEEFQKDDLTYLEIYKTVFNVELQEKKEEEKKTD